MTHAQTCFSIDGRGQEAAEFWTSLVDDSRIVWQRRLQLPDGGGEVGLIDLVIGGTPYQILDAPGMGAPGVAASISLTVADQTELDRIWDAIVAAGGEEMDCGWVRDQFGVHWQIVPASYWAHLKAGDPAQGQRVAEALWTMRRLDVAALDEAARTS